jgi:uncharacterized protein (TIGR00730 family)
LQSAAGCLWSIDKGEQVSQKVISVFGSSRPQPESVRYEEARKVGRLLAEAGYAVATGGYMGTMAAVSQGAGEAGGHVIGVTADRIEAFRLEGKPNPWVNEEIRYSTLQERVMHLVLHNDGMIALPGGIGTLSEMALAWSLLQVGELPPRPLVLLGEAWPTMLKAYSNADYINAEHMDLLYLVDSSDAAVARIVEAVPLP